MLDSVQPPLSIKGIREGLLVTVDTMSFDQTVSQLQAELQEKHSFLRGSRVALQLGQRPLRKNQIIQLQQLFEQYELELWAILTEHKETRQLAREMNFGTRLAGSSTDLDGNKLDSTEREPKQTEASKNGSQVEAPIGGLVIKETLRSGRSIYHEGAVVVIGDVNPGAEIVAGGDVIVWGRLRGFVQAGAHGDETAVICALHLNPTQLRIAGQIAISPDGPQQHPVPEQVSIRNGQIVAEPWQR
ncbi:MAG: septum site-determining protein MinC [Chloroflexi bacterium]|nr:MAG: septum site-determining protein MinC [Chloroflexota bacterium]